MSLSSKLAAVRASAPTGGKRSHPDYVHYLVSQLKSSKGTDGGMSVKTLAAYLTERGYSINPGQIHGMVYSETAKKSHVKAVERFQGRIDSNDTEALNQVAPFVDDEPTEDAAE